MESRVHGFAHRKLSNIITQKLSAMNGIDEHLLPFGEAHYQGKQRTKRADESWMPRRLPKYRSSKWPTLVAEVGYTESSRKLVRDIEWWMTESEGDVRAAITIAIDQRDKEITIENWKFDDGCKKTYRTVLSQESVGEQRICISNDDLWLLSLPTFFCETQGESLRGTL